ncbi:hypothetical protein LINPERPRIM_LOCUS21903 [Linum perenne]
MGCMGSDCSFPCILLTASSIYVFGQGCVL